MSRVGIAGEPGTEAPTLAAVVNLFHTAIFGEIPAEAVAAARFVRGRVWCERREPGGFADELVLVECGVPFREVGDGGINTAIAEDGTGEALIGALPGV